MMSWLRFIIPPLLSGMAMRHTGKNMLPRLLALCAIGLIALGIGLLGFIMLNFAIFSLLTELGLSIASAAAFVSLGDFVLVGALAGVAILYNKNDEKEEEKEPGILDMLEDSAIAFLQGITEEPEPRADPIHDMAYGDKAYASQPSEQIIVEPVAAADVYPFPEKKPNVQP